jgi:hypothetical protein
MEKEKQERTAYPSFPPPQVLMDDVLGKLAEQANEQVRDAFQRIAGLSSDSIARKIEYLINHEDWRANAEGIKLRARIAGDFAPDVVAVRADRAEDLGGMDEQLGQIPVAILLAMVQKTRRELGE